MQGSHSQSSIWARLASAYIDTALRPYQRLWLDAIQQTGFAAILGGRQIGKDWTLGAFVALRLWIPDDQWNTSSATRDHAKAFLSDVRTHYTRLADACRALSLPYPKLTVDAKQELATDWGSGVASHASTERSIVGRRGSFILNEVSQIPDAEALFEAAYPIVTGARGNGREAFFIIVGNASHQGSYWQTLWDGLNSRRWQRVITPWSAAMRLWGMPGAQIDAERERILSDLGLGVFQQWYECQWRPVGSYFYHPALLEAQTYGELPARWNELPQFVGYDVGRVNDPSAFCRLLDAGPGGLYALPTEIMRQAPYPDQRRRLKAIVGERRTLRGYVDATGNDDLAKQVRAETGGIVQPFHLTSGSKWGIFTGLRNEFELNRVWIPRTDTDLRMELESVTTEGKDTTLRIVLPRNDKGHGDRAVALALGVEARGKASTGVDVPTVPSIMPRVKWT